MSPVSIALIGAGNRGSDVYGAYLLRYPHLASIHAVADLSPSKRKLAAARFNLPAERCFSSWEELLADPQRADALIIATPDAEHVAPTIRALELGFDILLEKPIAPDLAGVLAVEQAAQNSTGSVTVAHVLRHSRFFMTLKGLLEEGRVGQLIGIQHTENIAYWHFAHSYVRGNWRREDASSPLILAKAVHDLDLIRWLAGTTCISVSSFGRLTHFRRENAPEGSTKRCTDGCVVERSCPYSAIRIYTERFGAAPGWPNSVLTPDPDYESVMQALQTGPYGRCVYRTDNDVVDHQVVSLAFEGGVTASLTVSAFTEEMTRTIHVMGSHGEIHGHMDKGELTVNNFRSGNTETIQLPRVAPGHSEADEALTHSFAERLVSDEVTPGATDISVSIESHLMAFAAERSRREGVAVDPRSLRAES